jgi:hypothetical protein
MTAAVAYQQSMQPELRMRLSRRGLPAPVQQRELQQEKPGQRILRNPPGQEQRDRYHIVYSR